MGEAPRDLSWLSLKLFLFEGVDEFYGGEEPDAFAVVLDGLAELYDFLSDGD